MTRTAIVIAAALAFAATLPAVPAHAAARDRVFVASYGNDSNPCTFLSPCKTFQMAVDVVAVGGEVTAIDSAGFGPISITQPVTITSPDGVEAGIVPNPDSPAISINTSGDVFLRGLTIDGGDSGTDGVSLTNAGTLGIVHCVIRHFTHDGIYLQPTNKLGLSVLNTIASNNGNDGIDLSPSGSDGYIYGVIDHSTATSNGVDGMNVWGASSTYAATAPMTIVNSVSANNLNNGITVNTTAGHLPVSVMVRDTTASNNGASGIQANGYSQIILAHSEATGNATGVYVNGSTSLILSFGDNHIYGNGVSSPNNVAGTLVPVTFY